MSSYVSTGCFHAYKDKLLNLFSGKIAVVSSDEHVHEFKFGIGNDLLYFT
jgi:hypothetical protein